MSALDPARIAQLRAIVEENVRRGYGAIALVSSAETLNLLGEIDRLTAPPTVNRSELEVQKDVATEIAPPTDDEREALADVRYTVHGGTTMPDGVFRVGHPAAKAILAADFRRQGQITEAPTKARIEAAAKAVWVAQQDDEAWARCVVDDVFSPADDWPEEALQAAAIARAALEATR